MKASTLTTFLFCCCGYAINLSNFKESLNRQTLINWVERKQKYLKEAERLEAEDGLECISSTHLFSTFSEITPGH